MENGEFACWFVCEACQAQRSLVGRIEVSNEIRDLFFSHIIHSQNSALTFPKWSDIVQTLFEKYDEIVFIFEAPKNHLEIFCFLLIWSELRNSMLQVVWNRLTFFSFARSIHGSVWRECSFGATNYKVFNCDTQSEDFNCNKEISSEYLFNDRWMKKFISRCVRNDNGDDWRWLLIANEWVFIFLSSIRNGVCVCACVCGFSMLQRSMAH